MGASVLINTEILYILYGFDCFISQHSISPPSASVIHWTRQIKEVLSAQDALEMSESSGPLEEIAFWKSRCTDLSGISKQLDQEGVQNIKEILTLSKWVDRLRAISSSISTVPLKLIKLFFFLKICLESQYSRYLRLIYFPAIMSSNWVQYFSMIAISR